MEHLESAVESNMINVYDNVRYLTVGLRKNFLEQESIDTAAAAMQERL